MEPELPGLKVEAWGDTLAVRGAAARPHDLPRHALERDRRHLRPAARAGRAPSRFAVGPAPAALFAPGGDFVVLDPAGGPRFPVLLDQPRLAARRGLRGGPRGLGRLARVPAEKLARRGGDAAGAPRHRHHGPGRRRAGRARRDAPSTWRRPSTGGLGQVVLVVRPTSPSKERRRDGRPGLDPGDPHRPRRVRRRGDARRVGERPRRREAARRRRAAARAHRRRSGRRGPSARARTRRGLARDSPLARLARRALARGAPRARTSRSCPPQTGWWSEGAGWRRAAPDRRPSLLRVRRPEDVPPRRGGARQGLAAADRGRARAATWRRSRPEVNGLAWTLRDSQGNEIAKGEARVERPRRLRPRAEAAGDDEPRPRRRCSSRPRAPRSTGASTPTSSRCRSSGGRSSR